MKKTEWRLSVVPKCFESAGQWRNWAASIDGMSAPCADCCPAYRERMHAEGRCERPETLFYVSPTSGEVVGVTAEVSEYAAILAGEMAGRLPTWPWPSQSSPDWILRLRRAHGYACRQTRVAIEACLGNWGVSL